MNARRIRVLERIGPVRGAGGALLCTCIGWMLAASGLPGCGGTGTDDEAPVSWPAGAAAGRLVVSGGDFEMGKAHGTGLRDHVRDFVRRRLREGFSADPAAGAPETVERFCRLYVAQAKALLPGSVREELRGLSEGSGVPEDDLLLVESMRDGLRWHAKAARLVEAALGSPPVEGTGASPGGPEVGAALTGPDVSDLDGHWLVLERRPTGEGRSPTLVVTWPGGLGAFAGVSGRGIVAASGEVRLPLERESLKGPPFGIGFRLALEEASDPADFLARLPKTSGHRVLAAGGGPQRRLALVALAGDEPVVHDGRAWVLQAPGDDASDPRRAALDARLGAFAERPGADDLGALLAAGVSGVSRDAPWPLLRLSATGIRWQDVRGSSALVFEWSAP